MADGGYCCVLFKPTLLVKARTRSFVRHVTTDAHFVLVTAQLCRWASDSQPGAACLTKGGGFWSLQEIFHKEKLGKIAISVKCQNVVSEKVFGGRFGGETRFVCNAHLGVYLRFLNYDEEEMKTSGLLGRNSQKRWEPLRWTNQPCYFCSKVYRNRKYNRVLRADLCGKGFVSSLLNQHTCSNRYTWNADAMAGRTKPRSRLNLQYLNCLMTRLVSFVHLLAWKRHQWLFFVSFLQKK